MMRDEWMFERAQQRRPGSYHLTTFRGGAYRPGDLDRPHTLTNSGGWPARFYQSSANKVRHELPLFAISAAKKEKTISSSSTVGSCVQCQDERQDRLQVTHTMTSIPCVSSHHFSGS